MNKLFYIISRVVNNTIGLVLWERTEFVNKVKENKDVEPVEQCWYADDVKKENIEDQGKTKDVFKHVLEVERAKFDDCFNGNVHAREAVRFVGQQEVKAVEGKADCKSKRKQMKRKGKITYLWKMVKLLKEICTKVYLRKS